MITEIRDDDGIPMALVDAGSPARVSACLLTCPDAGVGQTVLIHSGYVLEVLQESP